MTGGHALHTRGQFNFVAHAPFDIAWPLFGAEGERAWAPGWDPRFLWPPEPIDQQGMVFRISHELGTAIWVNTAFDKTAKRIQYVYVIPDVVLTVISLRLMASGETTQVEVTYERTALSESAADRVADVAKGDKSAGGEWSRQIDHYLRHCRLTCRESAHQSPALGDSLQ
jgi:hypothetical protein